MKYCPDCGLEDHPHQTCAEANMTDEEVEKAEKPPVPRMCGCGFVHASNERCGPF